MPGTFIASHFITGLQDAVSIPAAFSVSGHDAIGVLINTGGTRHLDLYDFPGWDVSPNNTVTLPNSPTNVCLLAYNKFAGISSADGNAFICDSSTATNYSNSDTALIGQRGQILASQPASGIAFGCTATAGKVIKFDNSGPTVTEMTLNVSFLISGDTLTCVIPKGTTGFIFGSNKGGIYETDLTGKMVAQYGLPDVRQIAGTTIPFMRAVSQLAYSSNGYLLVSTTFGENYLYDHDSHKLLQTYTVASTGFISAPPLILSPTIGQIVFAGWGGNSIAHNTYVAELDMLVTPIALTGFEQCTFSQNPVKNIGNVGNNWWVTCPAANLIEFYSTSSTRSLTNESISFLDGSSNPVAGELIAFDDSVSPTNVMFHTTIPAAGKSVPLTHGKNVLLLAKIGEGDGANAQFEVHRIST